VTATVVASAQNLKPFFKQLRQRVSILGPSFGLADNQDTPQDVLRAMAEIVHYMQIRSYQRANDAYLRLSIGNSAWPIGVTSIGLHERSADQGISEGVVAHVLNDEVSRKWIQAVKR
jgi:pre-mRNA-splicing factor 18